jgi:putative ABC transport system ATP-binding protein
MSNESPTSATARAGGEPLIRVRDVVKTYHTPSGPFPALRGVSLEVRQGERVAVVGKSGSGKSTLLHLMSGIDHPSAGEVHVAGTAVHSLAEGRLARWRGRNVGVVFQFFQLLPTLTVAENVMLPMDFCATWPPGERRARALALLEQVGIAEQADKLPSALSGGQQQRAAIARALANDPPLLVADEPTGNLDSGTAEAVLRLFTGLARRGKTVVIVTHDRELALGFDRVLTLADGALVSEEAPGQRGARDAAFAEAVANG